MGGEVFSISGRMRPTSGHLGKLGGHEDAVDSVVWRDVVVVALVGPVFLTAVGVNGGSDAQTTARYAVAGFVPFTGFGLLLWLFFRFGLPRLEPWLRWRTNGLAARLALLSLLLVALAIAGSVIVYPAFAPLADGGHGFWLFVLTACALCLTTGLGLDSRLRSRRRIRRSEKIRDLEREARSHAQLRALEARIRPHFLFNTLNTVGSLIHDDPELAERTIERLSNMMRYALDAPEQQLVAVEAELNLVRDYLGVEQARFGGRFTWSIDQRSETDGFMLPPLSLQPLVENAVVHGMSRRETGGSVTVEVRASGKRLVCEVEDNGPGDLTHSERSTSGSGTSLRELEERLSLLFDGDATLETREVAFGGRVVQITVPPRSRS
ncbi:MAG: histidine kinase [Actinomycetota bacterium]